MPLLLIAATAVARPGPFPTTFATRADPRFGDAARPLRAYVARVRPRARGVQHFCVVGYVQPSGDRVAQVHWREGRRLILWEGGAGPRDGLRHSRRDLDLTRDVVADERGVGGSTYLVTRDWIARVLADCARHGTRYAVRR